MREIDVGSVTEAVSRMCMAINYELSGDMKEALKKVVPTYHSPEEVNEKV